jgi:DNA (cytosine-5)-methyltransferase 1
MNDLVFEFLRFVKVLRPKTLMMENVPGLFRDPRLKRFCRVLSSLGYRWDCDVLDASEYGVPQRRRRMILLASRVGPSTFASKSRRTRTVREAISHLEAPGKSGDPLHDHQAHRTPHVQSLIEKIPADGGGRSSLPQHDQLDCHKKTSGFKDVYGRMAWDRPAPTITGGCINPSKGRFLHPDQHRAITLREAALLQGFPGRYKFPLRRGTYPVAQMIGNAFPPQFAMRHARMLTKQLRLQKKATRN